MRNNNGQNMVEYILLVTSVLIVSIYFFSKGPMSQSVNASLNSIVNEIDIINSQIQISST